MKAKKPSNEFNSVKGGNHNGVASLGRDRHGRQVVPDRYQDASLTNKSRTIATWNVRTLLEKEN